MGLTSGWNYLLEEKAAHLRRPFSFWDNSEEAVPISQFSMNTRGAYTIELDD